MQKGIQGLLRTQFWESLLKAIWKSLNFSISILPTNTTTTVTKDNWKNFENGKSKMFFCIIIFYNSINTMSFSFGTPLLVFQLYNVWPYQMGVTCIINQDSDIYKRYIQDKDSYIIMPLRREKGTSESSYLNGFYLCASFWTSESHDKSVGFAFPLMNICMLCWNTTM